MNSVFHFKSTNFQLTLLSFINKDAKKIVAKLASVDKFPIAAYVKGFFQTIRQ